MSLPVVLTAETEADFNAAADWYEEQAGRGAKFTVQLRKVLNQVGLMPELHGVIHQDIRCAKVDRFPYLVYYRVQAGRVEVLAVLHGRRDPSVWKRRT